MSYKIIGKYIKDLNFNIPNPKTFFLLSKNISNYKINIDIKSAQIKQNIIGSKYVPNDLIIGKDNFDGMLLFGTNASGKSCLSKSLNAGS